MREQAKRRYERAQKEERDAKRELERLDAEVAIRRKDSK